MLVIGMIYYLFIVMVGFEKVSDGDEAKKIRKGERGKDKR